MPQIKLGKITPPPLTATCRRQGLSFDFTLLRHEFGVARINHQTSKFQPEKCGHALVGKIEALKSEANQFYHGTIRTLIKNAPAEGQ